MNTSITTLNNETTITSLELLNTFINPAREVAGENKIENRHFVSRIEDELEDELGVAENFYVTTSQGANRNIKGYTLTVEQAMIISMRESKAVRRSVVKQLQELQARVEVAEQAIDAITKTETHEEALSIAYIAQEQRKALRLGHKEDTQRIAQAIANGTLVAAGHEHNFIHTRVSMFLFGCAPCMFKRNTGMDMRDYFENTGNIEALTMLTKTLERIITLSELGFTKDQLMEKFPTNSEKYFK